MMRRRAVVIAAVATTLAAAAPAGADPADPSPTWIPDGIVNAVAIDGETAYVGGQFRSVAPYTGASLLIDRQSGAPRSSWPDVAGLVRASASDGAGGWYVGGAFTSVGGVPRTNLAHVLADGTVDPAWAPASDRDVRALLVSGGTVYAGGSFTNVAGAAHSGIVALDSKSGAPSTVRYDVTGGQVLSLAMGGTEAAPQLYAGGEFDLANGEARRGLVAFAPADGAVTSFAPKVEGTVYDVAIGPEGVYAGGFFGKVNGTKPARSLAAFDQSSGALVTTWSPQLAGLASVTAVEVAGDTVYVGGRFDEVNESYPTMALRSNAAAFDATSGAVTSWDPDVEGHVDAIEAHGSTVYLGGDLRTVNGTTARPHLAAVTADSGAALSWNPQPRGSVLTIQAAAGQVLAGGYFKSAGGVDRANVAAIDLTTGRPTAFRADLNDTVRAVAVGADSVWVGGDFTKVDGGTPRGRIAALDPATGAPRPFAQELDGEVNSLAVDGATVYAGGRFKTVGTTVRRSAAAFRAGPATAGELLPFDPDPDRTVLAVAVGDGRVYLGGAFESLRGGTVPRRGLASVDPATGEPSSWNPNLGGHASSLRLEGGKILVAGDFNTPVKDSLPRRGVVELDTTTGAPTSWDAGLSGSAHAIAGDGAQVFAAGDFAEPRELLGGFDAVSGAVAPWAPSIVATDESPVRVLAATPDRWLVAGGPFLIDEGPVRTANLAVFSLAPVTSVPGGGAGGGGGGGGGGNARDRTAPNLSRLTASRKRFRVGKLPRRGTTLSLTLSEPASVSFEALVITTGRKTGKGCRRPTRSNRKGKRCRLLMPAGSFEQRSPAGASRVSFTGRLGKRALRPGGYVLRAKPTDAAGNAGGARSVSLRVVR
jgi:hypothetical protein